MKITRLTYFPKKVNRLSKKEIPTEENLVSKLPAHMVSISKASKENYNKYKNLPIKNEIHSLAMIKHASKPSKKKEDDLDDLRKCIIISSRIMDGDRVPLKDENFLAEKQPEMYLRAKLFRKRKKDSEDYNSVLDDEDEESKGKEEQINLEFNNDQPIVTDKIED